MEKRGRAEAKESGAAKRNSIFFVPEYVGEQTKQKKRESRLYYVKYDGKKTKCGKLDLTWVDKSTYHIW